MKRLMFLATGVCLLLSQSLSAQTKEVPSLDSGNTAWILAATMLVMLMTLPGLAFFYGGMVRRKNVLSVMMQCVVLTAVITIEWIVFGYTAVFGTSFQGSWIGELIGGMDKFFLYGIDRDALTSGNIP